MTETERNLNNSQQIETLYALYQQASSQRDVLMAQQTQQIEAWKQRSKAGEERMSKLTPADVKNVYLACDMRDPSGMYANDVDLLEFADKMEQLLMYRLSQAPREPERTCVRCKHAIVSSKDEPCKGCFSFDKWEAA